MGAKYMEAYNDSQLVVGQVKGDYEAKEKIMTKYLKVVGELVRKFDKFNITQVPRDQNEEADQLARIATG